MNSSDPGFNASSPSPPTTTTTGGSALSSLTTALSLSTPGPSDPHDPEVTIMVVLGLAVLLAGVSAFLALRRSGGGGDSGGSDSAGGLFCGPRGGLGASGHSSEPQLKVWRRLGSYRRCYNVSFRRPRPPPCRSHEARSPGPGGGGAGQTLGPGGGGAESSAAAPCLFDYVTEI